MNKKNNWHAGSLRNYPLLLIVFLFSLYACNKDQNGIPEKEFTYLVDYEELHTLQKNVIIATQTAVALQYPEINQLKDSIKYNVDVYRVLYRTSIMSEQIVASGLVCIPSGKGIFPILSFQNGTNTAHANAPTENAGSNTFMLLQGLAGTGYIMLIPDYAGFGASDSLIHPYFIKDPTSRSVIDFIRASREFIDYYIEEVAYTLECYLAGYSQGGWASLVVLQALEQDKIADIEVKAVSCGAGAYNLKSMTEYVISQETYPGSYYLPYFLYTHQQYGLITEPMQKYFLEPYASLIPSLFDGSFSNQEVRDQLTDTIRNLLTPSFVNTFPSGAEYEEIREDMISNSIFAWQTNTMLRFYHGTDDEDIPPEQSMDIYQDFLSSGSTGTVEHFEIAGAGHSTGILPWGISTLIWFNELRASYSK